MRVSGYSAEIWYASYQCVISISMVRLFGWRLIGDECCTSFDKNSDVSSCLYTRSKLGGWTDTSWCNIPKKIFLLYTNMCTVKLLLSLISVISCIVLQI